MANTTDHPSVDRRASDKRLVDLNVNLPTLAVIILQTFAAAWGLSALFGENAMQTKQLADMSDRIHLVERAVSGTSVVELRIATMENEMRLLRGHMERMDYAKPLGQSRR